ncbi:MAG: efflux RND transporter periplasmic adaptor subunit [Myxococcota bacterium]
MSKSKWIPLLVLVALVTPLVAQRVMGGPTVPARTVTTTTLVQTVAATGRVRGPGRLELTSEIAGVIVESRCQEGRHVDASAVLLRLKDEELSAQLAEADAQLRGVEARYEELAGASRKADEEALRRAEIALADAADRLSRIERLGQSGAVEAAQVDDARRKRDQASSQLESARATVMATGAQGPRVRQLRAQLDEARARRALASARRAAATIVAPAAGVIADCRVLVGDVVSPNKSLLTLVLEGQTEIVIEPDEKNLALLAPGQSAVASVDAYPDRVFPAKVSRIVRAVDPLRGTIEVRLVADPLPDFLVPDMTTSVEITVEKKDSALAVPREAVQGSETKDPWVFVHRAGIAERRSVKLGIRGDQSFEVREGLVSGEVVLLPGRKPLTPGSRVRAELGGG